jgi:hypothetical protein
MALLFVGPRAVERGFRQLRPETSIAARKDEGEFRPVDILDVGNELEPLDEHVAHHRSARRVRRPNADRNQAFVVLPSLIVSTSTLSRSQAGDLTLHGVVFKPEGTGPFPAVLYNHGSAPGMMSKEAFDALGPAFAAHGWVFFGPYRRGQGLSAGAGPYIMDKSTAP